MAECVSLNAHCSLLVIQDWSMILSRKCLFTLWTAANHRHTIQPAAKCLASMSSKTKVAVAQMTATGDTQGNYQTCLSLVKQASAENCEMVCFPECFSFIGKTPQESRDVAESLDGPLMQRFRQLAETERIWLSLGGFQEKGPDEQHIYNTHVVVDDKGEILADYHKVHLFDVNIPGGPVLTESDDTTPGDKLVVCDSPAGRLGLSICYDLRFPQLFQELAFSMGAQILLVPAAFTATTGEAHWEVLLRARAIECQCFVIAAAQTGRHNEKRESFGHSMIINPWGKVISRLTDPSSTGIAVAEIDLEDMHSVRSRMPVGDHRKAAISSIHS